MFRTVITLIRGQSRDAAEALADARALPILRQQLRDCAEAVDLARRNVAVVMAHAEREKARARRIADQLADLETRALAALARDREDLATEAAGAIAQLEADRATTDRALATYEAEIARLRVALADSETRLRDLQRGQRLAVATQTTQAVRMRATGTAAVSLSEAEATLARLQDRQQILDATCAAELALSAATNAETMRDRLAAAGCGAARSPDAAAVLERLKRRSA